MLLGNLYMMICIMGYNVINVFNTCIHARGQYLPIYVEK